MFSPESAFADAVAEPALGLAIELVNGIAKADREFRRGVKDYGLDGNVVSFSLHGASVGLIC